MPCGVVLQHRLLARRLARGRPPPRVQSAGGRAAGAEGGAAAAARGAEAAAGGLRAAWLSTRRLWQQMHRPLQSQFCTVNILVDSPARTCKQACSSREQPGCECSACLLHHHGKQTSGIHTVGEGWGLRLGPYKVAGSTCHSATHPSRLAVKTVKQRSPLLLGSGTTAVMQLSCGPMFCCCLPPLPTPPVGCSPAAASLPAAAPAAALPPPAADAAAACCSNILMRALREAERGGAAGAPLPPPPPLVLLGLTPAQGCANCNRSSAVPDAHAQFGSRFTRE